MGWLRRALIELWAMAVLSGLVGFLGPFGTYLDGDLPSRSLHWWMQLMGAYVLVRPSIMLWAAIAQATSLPSRLMVFWGIFLSSFPLALLWDWSTDALFDSLKGFTGILPFAMLSALGVLGVTVWTRWADAWLQSELDLSDDDAASVVEQSSGTHPRSPEVFQNPRQENEEGLETPRLMKRLSPGFQGPVIALQSEDHYVRVHGPTGSQLILMRLRDAISEMDEEPGVQVHRSWWVAQGGIESTSVNGRKCTVRLRNGTVAPVARASLSALQSAGVMQQRRRDQPARS